MSLKPEQGQVTRRRMLIVFGTCVMVMWKKGDCLYHIIIFTLRYSMTVLIIDNKYIIVWLTV